MNIREYLKTHKLMTDGSMGTYYAEKTKVFSHPSEMANTMNPEAVKDIHLEYIKAGARLIRTNTFASNKRTLIDAQQGYSEDECDLVIRKNIEAGCDIAHQAVEESKKDVFIAGDIGPILAKGTLEEVSHYKEYCQMADVFIEKKMAVILFETFPDYGDILPVAEYIKSKSDIFIMASFCLNKFGYTPSGISAGRILNQAADSPYIDSVGFNCGIGPAHLYGIMKQLDFKHLIISAAPNSGYPDIIKDRNVYQENIEYFAGKMSEIDHLGINILGGCCGTSPRYISRLSQRIDLGQVNPRKSMTATGSIVKGADASSNDFMNKLHSGKKVIVVELDPPYNGDIDKVVEGAGLLKQAGVDMLTFSDSPMARMRADAIIVGAKIQREVEISVMPHISCRDKNVIGLGSGFLGAHIGGIRNMLIVTGDPIPVSDKSKITPVYDFNSIKLMEYFSEMNREYFGRDPIVFGGALNYNRSNIEKEIDRVRRKMEHGAAYFLSQPVFCQEDIDRIADIKAQTGTKILGGIMPLVSYKNAVFIKNEIHGIDVPDEIVARYQTDMIRAEAEQIGISIALELTERLEPVVDGYYFMVPFNRTQMIRKIIERMD